MIIVRYTSIDRYSQTRRFKTLKGAQAFAHKYVGPHPTLGTYYAVSDDGVGRVTVSGCSLQALFPTSDCTPASILGIKPVMRDRDDPSIGKELAAQAREYRTMPRNFRDQE